MKNRRDFIKSTTLLGAGMFAGASSIARNAVMQDELELQESNLSLPGSAGLKITGTFLDEISHDIPHQNWGEKEWDQDFKKMKDIGIDTVIMIRCGHKKFIAYPSKYLMSVGCYQPSIDLLALFLKLAQKYEMKFYFGLYDLYTNGKYEPLKEVEYNLRVIDEVWENYGSRYKSFGGWYLSREISRASDEAINLFNRLGKHCKDVSNGLPTFISPWIDGKKAISSANAELTKAEGVSISQHEKEWNDIFSGIHQYVDACAFQDGHIDFDELDAFFELNKKLTDKYNIACWTNAETFDRDMPIKFLPIKFDKLRLKLEAAKRAGYEKAITFEFSHFMSPQSSYPQAGHLYNRYKEYFKLK